MSLQQVHYKKQPWFHFSCRANYTLADKYIFSLSGRYDGASQLSTDNKWSFFPAASFAWRVKEEDFLKENKLFSDLKFRIGYGITGNASIAPYSTAASLNAIHCFMNLESPEEKILHLVSASCFSKCWITMGTN